MSIPPQVYENAIRPFAEENAGLKAEVARLTENNHQIGKHLDASNADNKRLEAEVARLRGEVAKALIIPPAEQVEYLRQILEAKAEVARLTKLFGDFKSTFTNWGEGKHKNDELKRLIVDALKGAPAAAPQPMDTFNPPKGGLYDMIEKEPVEKPAPQPALVPQLGHIKRLIYAGEIISNADAAYLLSCLEPTPSTSGERTAVNEDAAAELTFARAEIERIKQERNEAQIRSGRVISKLEAANARIKPFEKLALESHETQNGVLTFDEWMLAVFTGWKTRLAEARQQWNVIKQALGTPPLSVVLAISKLNAALGTLAKEET